MLLYCVSRNAPKSVICYVLFVFVCQTEISAISQYKK